MRRIAVVGGGISGMTAAFELSKSAPSLPIEVTLFEGEARLGGILQTSQIGGYLVEHSADNFLVTEDLPFAADLCQQLGIELLETDPEFRGAEILRHGELLPIPDGLHLMSIQKFGPLLSSKLLSWRGKLRVLCEPFVAKNRTEVDESLTQFATRRFGREMCEQIIQPLVGGIYTADPDRLSVKATLPQFVAWEQKYGSLAQAALHQKTDASSRPLHEGQADRGARYSLFRAPRRGMQELIDRLEQALVRQGVILRRNAKLTNVYYQSDHGWIVQGTQRRAEIFDGLIVATDARSAAKLLAPSSIAESLRQIPHATTAVVCLGVARDEIGHPLKAFGSVIPRSEKRRILAISFSSLKFPERAPAGKILLRTFVGGALQPELAQLPDDGLLTLVRDELRELLGYAGCPELTRIVRWIDATPQYEVGHLARLERLESQLEQFPHMALAGNAFRGIGVPQCIRSGLVAARRVQASLRK